MLQLCGDACVYVYVYVFPSTLGERGTRRVCDWRGGRGLCDWGGGGGLESPNALRERARPPVPQLCGAVVLCVCVRARARLSACVRVCV